MTRDLESSHSLLVCTGGVFRKVDVDGGYTHRVQSMSRGAECAAVSFMRMLLGHERYPLMFCLRLSLTKVVNVRALARQPTRFAATTDVSAFSITDQSEPHQMSTTVCKLCLTKAVNVCALARQPIRFAATPDVSAFSITDQSKPHQMSTTVCKLCWLLKH
ncbi:hypothetical protein Tco_0750477 [Tanacetum coccineum]|uniref:Uncharacterized protein n=1 Tax=Tanacetum coccineum TaxID=301880 RepID=A0ABQ4Z2T2_9ASTR